MLRLCILVALLSVCFGAVTLEERVASITAEAPSFHSLILKNSAFKLARNRAINTVISKRRKAIINALSLPQALNKKSESADDILHLDDDFFNLDDLIPTFDDDTFSFDDDIFNIDDQFDFDDAFTFDDDYFSFDDDFWSFDDDTFSFDDDMWSFDDDTAYSSVDGYVSYAFTYGDTCSGTKTMEVGVVAGTCFSDYVASYMLQFSDATCNGLRVSFYEDTSCSSLLYTIPIDGFTDCMMVPMANGTFYSSAQGMCSPGYTVSVDMNSVLLTVFENTETCAGVPVVYAAVATDVCLTVDDEESYELSCDAEFDIFSGTNYTSSGSCAAGSSGQQDFLFPLLCYDSSELSDLPISTYAMHHGHVGTPQRQPEDRTMVKTQRSVKRIHSAGGQPTVVKHQTRSSGDVSLLLRGKNSRKVSRVPLKIQTSSKQVRKDVYQRNKQRHLNSILNGNKQNKKQKKQQQKKPNKLVKALTKAGAKSRPVDVKRSHFHLRGGPRVASADDILHLDDDFIHIDDGLFSDDLFPSFDDDLFSLDDDIFDGFDDAITFDDDFWSFDDQEFSLDDDFWSFDDDLFSFDDNADDDWYSSAVFSFDIKCGTTSNPITYTPLPTVMPTGMPVAPPTMGPTAMPSQSVPAYVSFDVTQMLYGMSYDTYQSNADLYASTLIDSIAECMTGVTSDNIDSFNAAAGSRRLLQVLFFEIADSSSDSLILTYTVTVDSSYDYEALSNELQSNIASGQFDSYLQTNAQANDAPALATCYSDTASTTQTNTNSITDDNSSGGGSGELSDGAIVGVVIAVLVLVTVAYYLWARKSLSSGKSSAGDDRSVSSDSTNGSTAAAAAPKGPASEFVTLKDIQLKTAPVYGITTISNEKGNATDAHDSL